jgi:hypothetical protein
VEEVVLGVHRHHFEQGVVEVAAAEVDEAEHGDHYVEAAQSERVQALDVAPVGEGEEAEGARRDVNEVVPAVHGEQAAELVAAARADRISGLEAGVVEEADHPGDHEDAADQHRVQPGRARSLHRPSIPHLADG